VSNEFRIVNRPPTLLLFPKATTVRSDRSVRVEGMAMHPQVAVRAVQFRVDNGEWVAGAADDGLFDTGMETFTLTTPPLAAGAHTIEVQAQDEAGNPVTQKNHRHRALSAGRGALTPPRLRRRRPRPMPGRRHPHPPWSPRRAG
jgi:hypothetical protein